MTPAEVLRDAADALVEHGWAQYAFRQPNGRMCAEGAVRFAVAGTTSHSRMSLVQRQEYLYSLLLFVRYLGFDVALWNDTEGQTQANVVATMRRVADGLDVREVDR